MSDSVVWVVDDDHSIRWVLRKSLEAAGLQVEEFESAERCLKALAQQTPDVVVTDVRMPGMTGFDLLELLASRAPEIPVVITTAHADLDSAVAAYQGGAFEYLPKPFDIDEAVDLVSRAVRQSVRSVDQTTISDGTQLIPDLIGSSPAMQEVFRAIGRLARSSINVLVTGESGTGKELIAKALHRHSPRAEGTFVALNMAAINRELLESELFGHEKGAFTGAQAQRIGRFEQAHRGTLFLDEIGDMPAELQTRLLRVLAEGEFYRVGGTAPIRVDVRIIAATHQSLEDRVASGTFREDLFHRLNVVRVRVPPLRERRDDIVILLQHFLAKSAAELRVDPKTLSSAAADRLATFSWPGNVRQLENVARWLTVMTATQVVEVDDLPPEVHTQESTAPQEGNWEPPLREWAARRLATGQRAIMDMATPAFEKVMIEVALERTGGRRQDAAALLGWGRNTLTRKIKDLGLSENR